VRGQDWSQQRFDALVRRVEEYLQGLPLEVEFWDAIAPAQNGKMRTIIAERAIEARQGTEAPAAAASHVEVPGAGASHAVLEQSA
jgi:hypothetical protein